MVFSCECGKTYKTEKGFQKHIKTCQYYGMDLKKIYRLGQIINESSKMMFHIHLGKIRKKAKQEKISNDEAKKQLEKDEIYKYRKSLWDILNVWEEYLIPSEYRTFAKWVFKTYKDINLLSLRNTLSNEKILYRFNIENTFSMIKKRVNESSIFIQERKVFYNDIEFSEAILDGDVSVYFVLFNDWLAEKWFGRLEAAQQRDLLKFIDIASNIIVKNLNEDEYNELHVEANKNTPTIYEGI